MTACYIVAICSAMVLAALVPNPVNPLQTKLRLNPSESRIKVANTSLYVRVIGKGPSVIVLHGGPDFDHSYLLPDLDRLKEDFRLIYRSARAG